MNADSIHQKFKTGLELGCNFAALRLPNSTDVYYFYASASPRMQRVQYTHTDQPVFLCSPYGAGNMAYQLKAEAVYKNDALVFGEMPTAPSTSKNWFIGNTPTNFFADQHFYEGYVHQIITHINQDKFDKVVAARSTPVNYTGIDGVANYFTQACCKYNNACVYFFSIDGIGSWLGATPEKLISVNQQTISTVALAGTRLADEAHEWTNKEYNEQGMIEFFIDAAFKQNGITKVKLSEVETITAGALQHLCSEFSIKLKADFLEAKFHKLLGTLNPTPAVCGLPQFEASLFISEKEQMERRFYSGFVGLQLPNHAIELFVNLRCAELFENHAIAYVGAGITSESNAQQEWLETERKLQTIQSIFN